MLSPCIRPGTETATPYNHYSLLRSIEDNFGLPHLGFAGQAGLQPFGEDVLSNPACGVPNSSAGTGAQPQRLRRKACRKKKKHRTASAAKKRCGRKRPRR